MEHNTWVRHLDHLEDLKALFFQHDRYENQRVEWKGTWRDEYLRWICKCPERQI